MEVFVLYPALTYPSRTVKLGVFARSQKLTKMFETSSNLAIELFTRPVAIELTELVDKTVHVE